ncbi:unnamed protein product, partial [Allacma fusca]
HGRVCCFTAKRIFSGNQRQRKGLGKIIPPLRKVTLHHTDSSFKDPRSLSQTIKRLLSDQLSKYKKLRVKSSFKIFEKNDGSEQLHRSNYQLGL